QGVGSHVCPAGGGTGVDQGEGEDGVDPCGIVVPVGVHSHDHVLGVAGGGGGLGTAASSPGRAARGEVRVGAAACRGGVGVPLPRIVGFRGIVGIVGVVG